jgi:RNA polymerase sigma factor (TIGR02999 family)
MSAPRADLDALIPEIYEELRKLAGSVMRRERPSHTLQTTALVHEAYLHIANIHGLHVDSRPRFLALAAQVMRRILVDHARARRAAKRGGDAVRVTLSDALADGSVPGSTSTIDLLALDEALTRLSALDEGLVRIVEMRFIAGMSVEETGEALAVSPTTVKRDSAMARAWLMKELSSGGAAGV